MLVHTDEGDTFTFKEMTGWLKQAGFRHIRQSRGPGAVPGARGHQAVMGRVRRISPSLAASRFHRTMNYMGAHTFDRDSRLVLDCIRRIVRALRLFDREAEKRVGLSGAQVFVLRKTWRRRRSIHQRIGRPNPHASKLRLGRRSKTSRPQAGSPILLRPADGRRVELSLTDRGRRVLRSAPPAAQERLIASLAALSTSRRRLLGRLLTELINNTGIERHPPALFFEDHAARSRRGVPDESFQTP